MQVLKQRISTKCRGRAKGSLTQNALPPAFWHTRSYDFNVFSKKKIIQKLTYIHWNPVKRGLVESAEQWQWSSYRFYFQGEEGPVKSDG
jgi:hypothetical protein